MLDYMNVVLIVSIGIAGIFLGAMAFYFFSRRADVENKPDQAILMLQQQIGDLTRTLDHKLGESTRFMQQQLQHQFGESTKIIKDITKELVKVGEGQKQVLNVTEQLKNLEDILKNPKQRGILGEYYLETLLKNVFPPGMYQMQYKLGKDDGGKDLIVDAVIFVKDKIIPIDSKFSLENYNRIREERDPVEREKLEKLFRQDLKMRIDETAKYVRPEDGTMDFAFMFIPAEGIYYDLLVNQVGVINARDLIEYAFIEKKVHIVSPTTFLSHLKMIIQGLRALQIEESAKDIKKRVEELGRHLISFEDYMVKVGKNLGMVIGAYNSAQKEFKKIDKDVLRITGASPGIEEQMALEKPEDVG